jgi:tRNA threonylcarbamoyladenosine biosynthesis protein TsaB
MTLLLGLDTATDRPTLALAAGGVPGADVALANRRDLSRDIERAAARLLADHGARPADLTGVVVADGPGSFTGLRIGIAFAKGLCRGLGVPLFTAPSLLGAARAAAPAGGTVLVAYDALRGEVYRAVYRITTGAAPRVEVALAAALAAAESPVPYAGALIPAGARWASAAALLALVGVPNGAIPVAEPADWEPAYGRPAEAEARLLARHGRPADA